jgi:hypothetical protein
VRVAVPLAVVSAASGVAAGLATAGLTHALEDDTGWLVVVAPVAYASWILAGAVLLGLGRSWRTLCLGTGTVAMYLLAADIITGWGAGPYGVPLLTWLVPGVTALLAARRDVRGWVDECCRGERRGGQATGP